MDLDQVTLAKAIWWIFGGSVLLTWLALRLESWFVMVLAVAATASVTWLSMELLPWMLLLACFQLVCAVAMRLKVPDWGWIVLFVVGVVAWASMTPWRLRFGLDQPWLSRIGVGILAVIVALTIVGPVWRRLGRLGRPRRLGRAS